MRKRMAEAIAETITGLNKIGVVDAFTMRNIEKLCLPEIPEYTGERIVRIRKKYKLSQSAMAAVINVSPSTVRQWERGVKCPAGTSSKLLNVLDRKGLEVLS